MTRAQTSLGYATLLMAAFAVLEVLMEFVLDIAAVTAAPMALWERVIIAGYLDVMRYLPFLMFPAVLAPAVVILLWLVPRTRPATLEAPELERRRLATWLWWVAGAGAVVCAGAALSRIRPDVVPVGIWAWALMTATWATAGALHRAFRLQSLRASAGLTRINATALAVAAAATLPFLTIGFVLPLWVLWASRSAGRPTTA